MIAILSRRKVGVGLMAVLAIAGCAVELQNTQAARDMEKASRPPGSIYTGWRIFQEKCARCHGSDASGTPGAPDLLPIVRHLGPRRFVSLVLTRYDWSMSAQAGGAEGAARDAWIESLVRREQGVLQMPAWQGEPVVNAHIVDLYAYLTARAEGVQGTGRPPRP
jgi:mono/diheme cytochrome c family protein